MHEKCIEFVVEYCREVCPNWSHCISTSSGFDKGDSDDKKSLLFCLKGIEYEIAGIEKTEEEIEKEIEALEVD